MLEELDSVEGIATDRFLSKSVGMLQQKARGIDVNTSPETWLKRSALYDCLSYAGHPVPDIEAWKPRAKKYGVPT